MTLVVRRIGPRLPEDGPPQRIEHNIFAKRGMTDFGFEKLHQYRKDEHTQVGVASTKEQPMWIWQEFFPNTKNDLELALKLLKNKCRLEFVVGSDVYPQIAVLMKQEYPLIETLKKVIHHPNAKFTFNAQAPPETAYLLIGKIVKTQKVMRVDELLKQIKVRSSMLRGY
ncbi:MAG: hypothetical protein AB1468_02185, partial [Candidatus Micrarchaeota archaeon]